MEARKLYFDVQSRQIVSDPGFFAPIGSLPMFREDAEPLELYFLDGNEYLDYSGSTVKLAVGNQGNPASGTFRITASGHTTSVLAHTVTAAQLKSAFDALNANAGLFGGGACTVTGQMPSFTVTVGANNVGSIANLTTTANVLAPQTGIRFIERQAAGASQPFIFDVVFERVPAALTTSWTSISSAVTASVTSLQAGGGGNNEVQQITLTKVPVAGGFSIQFAARSVTVSSVSANVFTAASHGLYDGQQVTCSAFTISSGTNINTSAYFIRSRTNDTFQLASTQDGAALTVVTAGGGGGTVSIGAISTGVIQFNAEPEDVQSAIADAGFVAGNRAQISVSGEAGKKYVLTFANGSANRDYANVALVGNTLEAARGLSGTLNLNTVPMRDLIALGENDSLTLEVEVAAGGQKQTYQSNAEVSADIITASGSAPGSIILSPSLYLSSPDNATWMITIDNDGVLTATKQ